jgi:protease I
MADKQLIGKSVVLVVPRTQFREEEVFEPQRILEREGASVQIASTEAGPCRGMREGFIEATLGLEDVNPEQHDGLIIAGGSSVPEYFWKSKPLAELVTKMSEAGRVIAAISLSTVVLAKASLLEGKNATVYYLPEAIDELTQAGARYVDDRLIVDGKLIMAEGPAEARAFSNAVATALTAR